MSTIPKKPEQITFDITDRCQMQCVTCSKWKTVASEVISKELTTEEWKKVLRDLHSWLGKGFSFCFSGGEPFLRQDIFEIADYAHSLGIRVTALSNAYSIQHFYEKIAESSFESLNISLNSINNPQIHDESRGREGSYDKIMDTITQLKKLRKEKKSFLKINLATILFPENIEEAIPLVEFVTKNEIDGIMFQLLGDKESFHGYDSQKDCETTSYSIPEELKLKYEKMTSRAVEVIEKLIEMKKDGHSIYNSVDQLKAMKLFFVDPDATLKEVACHVDTTNYSIDPYGDVRLCFNMEAVGNIKESSPKEIWQSEKAAKCREQVASCQMHCRILNCNFKRGFADFFNKSLFKRCKNKLAKIFSSKK